MSSFLRFDGAHATQAEAQYHSPEMVHQRQMVRRLLALAPGERVLDLGCGPGILAREMADEVGPQGRIEGLDISESMLALAQARCGSLDQVRLGTGRAETLPFDDNVFDAVVTVQVLEYVTDVEVAVGEMFRVLKPGGRAVILDTDWDSTVWFSDDRPRMDRVLALWDGHLADPRLPERLGPLLRGAGFVDDTLATLTFVNREVHEDTYSWWLIGFVESFIVDQHPDAADDARAWAEEQRALGGEGRYFFTLDRYAFRAVRPSG
jgi:arsenite methyltransferase